mmetsp:Transcript_66332/g.194102  ORF Transcript_66332/g.194102 Transcript_66332/m.194102 type:complete len:286 (-) Transcript_66332:235-1092(-)
MVPQALPEPLRVELAEGLREVGVPEERKQCARVVGADKVPERYQGQGEPALLQPVEPVRRVPAKLPVLEQVRRARVVLHVLHDHVLPGDAELVRPAVGDVCLPIMGREGGSMDHVMKAVDVLNAQPRHRDAEAESGSPEGQEVQEDGRVQDDQCGLRHEEQREYFPQVQHVVVRHFCEEERDGVMLEHFVLVRRRVHAAGLGAALRASAATCGCGRLGAVRLRGVGLGDVGAVCLLLGNLVAVCDAVRGVLLLQFIDVAVRTIEERHIAKLGLLCGLLQACLPRL